MKPQPLYATDKAMWVALRRAVLARDGFRCRKCRSGEQLDVHHKKPVARGGTDRLSNLQTLCRKCHRAWHSAHPIPRERQVSPRRQAWDRLIKEYRDAEHTV